MNYIALIIALLTYGLIATRGITKIPPWSSMFFGGVLMVAAGVIPVGLALKSVNLDVILFLVTIFVFASALEVSGFLKYLAYYIVKKFKTPKRIVMAVVVFSGVLSNFVTNDGISSSWTPVMLEVSKQMRIDEKPLLYSLAFGVTVGSVLLPTGNPQNLLIALEGNLAQPFVLFLAYLGIPTAVNLLATAYITFLMFKKSLANPESEIQLQEVKIEDKATAVVALVLLAITVVLFFALSFLKVDILLGSLITSSLLLLIVKPRREIVRRMDWTVIVFFVGLFLFTAGLDNGGVLSAISMALPPPSSVLLIMLVSVALSQILSNVPMVAIYIPIMYSYNATSAIDWLALAAGSTIAGNLTLIGAASNVIISEASESRGGKGFGFFEFIKYSLPVLLENFLVIYLFLRLESP
ncbi:MAG: SLC13 family permease [Candidatus Aramenus sulfurataquae]|uniref:Arsenic resistance protein ArsB n=2 Tax=Candidatus Aramenus sulfurataquae TaxID=1326980 RepID=A0A0F2LQL7_9CREN|nr:SLC13 family permease [Candidatus Aramenus sulfurataquae]